MTNYSSQSDKSNSIGFDKTIFQLFNSYSRILNTNRNPTSSDRIYFECSRALDFQRGVITLRWYIITDYLRKHVKFSMKVHNTIEYSEPV